MVPLFSPAQSERVMVCVQPYSSTTELHFSASFASSEEYHQARQDGVEVELWSNIPNAHGSDTKWGADRFVWPSGNYTGTSHASGEYFPIVCEGPSSLEVLHLRVGIPVSGRNQVEYTYRLVYPSGEIKWLGDYERNGVLVFEQRDPRFVHGIFFGSHMREGTYSLGRGGWHKKKIARLSQEVDWSIYAIGADGSSCVYGQVNQACPSHVSLAFFVPVLRPESLVIPSAFSLTASPGSSISVDALGNILITGPANGSMFIQTYGTESHLCQAAIQDSLSFCSFQKSYHLLSSDRGSSHIILTSQASTGAQLVSVIPFITMPSLSIQNVRVWVHNMVSLLPADASELALFSNLTQKPRFLKIPSDEKSEDAVTLLVGPECSQFIIAPVYDLRSRYGIWGVSILASHALATGYSMSVGPFPTPPPSPPLTGPPVLRRRRPSMSPTGVRMEQESQAIHQRITLHAGTQVALITGPLANITQYVTYLISLAIWLLKVALLRILLYYRVRRLPYEGVDDWSEDDDIAQGPIVWHGLGKVVEDDERSVGTVMDADFMVELGEQEMNGGRYLPLLLDVAGEDIPILLRPSVGVSSADLIKIELNGQPVQRNVQQLNDGISIVRIRGPVHGTLSIIAV